MALFDSPAFSPSNYGGLLGTLLSRLQFQQPTPSAGFADSQGSYGGIPFPIFGQQEQNAIPPAAAPAQFAPQQPQQQPQEPANLGSGVFANAPPGSLRAFIGDITGQTRNPVQATYQALLKSGVPDGIAQAAALNPEVLKTIAPQIYTKPSFGVIGQNQVGINQYGFIDPSKQSVNPVNTTGAPNAGSPGIDPSLTGEPFLAAVAADPQLGPGKAQMVKAIAE